MSALARQRMQPRVLRHQDYATDHKDGDDGSGEGATEVQSTLVERLVEEIPHCGAQRSALSSSAP